MATREGLLDAIAADPGDDTPRLILADWLDEHDDPLGEFIRLQMILEPLQHPRADPMEELIRVRCLRRIPPGSVHEDETWPVARQLDRQSELLRDHKAEWLGAAAPLEENAHQTHFAPEFRRGFVASAQIGLTALTQHGADLRRGCPTLQRLIVVGTLGRGTELADCAALTGLPDLLLAGWLTPNDATALAISKHLRTLRSLTLWIGTVADLDTCRTLTYLPGLRDLTLVQMYGGSEVHDPEALNLRADELASRVRDLRPDLRVRLERPFERRFPLDGIHIERGVNAGHLPGGETILTTESKQPILMYFDADGHFEREEQLDLSTRLFRPPPYSWEDCDARELIEVLGREIGFVPGPIFVREFFSEVADVGVCFCDVHLDELAEPHTTDPVEGEEIGASLYWWWSTNQFCLPYGNNYWADGLGRVHSS
jgi:uncharacterized protein (TIGR02996 family)